MAKLHTLYTSKSEIRPRNCHATQLINQSVFESKIRSWNQRKQLQIQNWVQKLACNEYISLAGMHQDSCGFHRVAFMNNIPIAPIHTHHLATRNWQTETWITLLRQGVKKGHRIIRKPTRLTVCTTLQWKVTIWRYYSPFGRINRRLQLTDNTGTWPKTLPR